MLKPDTPVNPFRLKAAQPANFARLMDCLKSDAPDMADLIENDQNVTDLIKDMGATLRIRFGDFPSNAQAVITEASQQAAKQ